MSAFYYSYRIFLTEPLQGHLFGPKEVSFRKIFERMEKSSVVFLDYSEHIIYHYKKIGDSFIIWQFSKRQDFEKPVAKENGIEVVFDFKHPFIYLVFDIKRQIVLIQYDSSVFQKLESSKSKLEKFLNDLLSPEKIAVTITEISDQREFWTKVEEMDVINDVTLEYNPPNFFHGENAVDELVDEVHKETNYQKFSIFLQNKLEGLTFKIDTFKNHISRLSSGAGQYIIRGFKDGIEDVLKSITVPFKKQIEDIDSCTEEGLEKDFKEIDELNETKKE